MIKRREFITLLGGAAAWPLAARAQQGDRVRRIGVLLPWDENEPRSKTSVSAFTQSLAGLGWADGRNVRMDLRWWPIPSPAASSRGSTSRAGTSPALPPWKPRWEAARAQQGDRVRRIGVRRAMRTILCGRGFHSNEPR